MARVDVVCIGDVHVEATKSILPFLGKKWFEPVEKVFLDTVLYCKANAINHVIFLGDIFNNPLPKQKSQLKFLKLLISEPSINFYCIDGNHDFSSIEETATEMLAFVQKAAQYKHIRFIRKDVQILKIDNVPFCFLPWPHTLAPFTSYPKVNIAHIELQDANYDNGMKIKDGVVLPENNDYWIIGHIHTYQEFKRAIYVGSPLQHNFGEEPRKSFSHFTVKTTESKLKISHKRIALATSYTLHNVRVQKDEDLQAVRDLPGHYYKLFVKRGYTLPDKFLDQHKNVIRHQGYRTKAELLALKKNNIIIDIKPSLLFDPTFNLEPYLQRDKMSEADVKKSVNIIRSLMKEV